MTRQHLAGARPAADEAGVLDLVRDLGCLQLDPLSVVARTHRLVLRSRLGNHDPDVVDSLLWSRRKLFEYWAHAASIVPTSDYPIHEATLMRGYPKGNRVWHQKVRAWVAANATLRRQMLAELKKRGPLRARDFSGRAAVPWSSTGWTEGMEVTRMLDYLWMRGFVAVVGREGQSRVWDLAERWLPEQRAARPRLSVHEAVSRAAERSLRGLGVATQSQIAEHFVRGRYPGLGTALRALVRDGRILEAEIAGDEREPWPGKWYVHADDLPLVEVLWGGTWEPRTTLLSPFDNLIADRARTEQLFGFRFRIEIYVPKAKREFGYYVLPILHGDTLIGRVDPAYDRRRERLVVNAVHAEPGQGPARGAAVSTALEELATFLGARSIDLSGPVPRVWRKALG
ncbi:MAG: winged helix-turn-helix domain-containing protein [Gaiellaceae bacterium]